VNLFKISCAVLVSCAAAVEGSAAAQDVANAQKMFQKGVADMEAGRYDTGCPELAESLQLDPHAGTRFTLAECYAKAGKTASAVARYQEYLNLFPSLPPDQQANQDDRPQVCQSQIARLTPQVPLLTLRLPAGAPSTIAVKRDGVAIGTPSLGVPLQVDPGSHVITTETPDGASFTQTVTIAPAERKDVVLALPGTSGRAGSAQLIAGFVIGGAGAVGLIVGAVTGGITLEKKSHIQTECNLDAKMCTTDSGLSDVQSAKTMGLASTYSLIAGGILLAGGVVIAVTAPHSSSSGNVRVGLSGGLGAGKLTLSGDF